MDRVKAWKARATVQRERAALDQDSASREQLLHRAALCDAIADLVLRDQQAELESLKGSGAQRQVDDTDRALWLAQAATAGAA